MKRSISVISGLLAATMVFAIAGCDNGKGTTFTNSAEWLKAYDAVPTAAYTLPTAPDFGSDVHVHDPSIFYNEDNGTYYAFGTHFSVATSTDLIKWTQVNNENNARTLYGTDNWTNVIPQSSDWTGGTTGSHWAPDVEKIGDKFYMYASVTTDFGSKVSAIYRLESENVMGPYSNEQPIVFSNGSGPNAIDPELFYDKEGKLWLVYGSAAAGLYIRELETKGDRVGLPKEGDETEYGKLLWKGGHNSEGPYIFYNAETDYYYMMCSYGDLNVSYNMRVARSKTPDGPYVDIKNTDVSTSAEVGNKLAGNYQFTGGPTDFALGHNSVIKKDGKYLVIHHIRNTASGMHHLEVRQLFFDKDGWPVLAPNRYAGETAGKFTAEDVAGTYDVVIHDTGLVSGSNVVKSVACELKADGTVTGEKTGTWTLDENGYYVTVTIDSVEYSGVVVPQWCKYKNAPVVSITATSAQGNPIWANGAAKTVS